MSDVSHDKVKLNVRVPPSKKKEWRDSLEGTETLSSLVRRAVDHEIRDEYVSKDAIDDLVGSKEQPDIDLSSVIDRLDEMQRTVYAFENKLDALSASHTREDEEDSEELAMDIPPQIPAYPSDIPEHVLRDMGGKGDGEPQEYIRFIISSSKKVDDFPILDGSAQRFSREMREPAAKVREALVHLETNTTENVHSAVIDGAQNWVRGL